MNATTSASLMDCILSESASLPLAQQQSLLDYARFLRHRSNSGDAIWNDLLDQESKRNNFASWATEAMNEGDEEPMDAARL